MKKNELKRLIKPVVKECIHEVLLESGLLTNIVSEVAQGMNQNVIVEKQQKQSEALFNEDQQIKKQVQKSNEKLREHRKKLMDSIGAGAYNGVNLFEGTEPLSNSDATSSGPQPGSVDLGDPNDAGVDISSLVGGASQIWKAMK
tara:strand:- start:5607 stop:6038 length:432 start_codon:yes stop_codon:yes gene_type:complete